MKKVKFLTTVAWLILFLSACNEVYFHPFIIFFQDDLSNKVDTFYVTTYDSSFSSQKNYFSLIPSNSNNNSAQINGSFEDTLTDIHIFTLRKLGEYNDPLHFDSLTEVTHLFKVLYVHNNQIYSFDSIHEFFLNFSHKPPVNKLCLIFKEPIASIPKPRTIELLFSIRLSNGKIFVIKNQPIIFYM